MLEEVMFTLLRQVNYSDNYPSYTFFIAQFDTDS